MIDIAQSSGDPEQQLDPSEFWRVRDQLLEKFDAVRGKLPEFPVRHGENGHSKIEMWPVCAVEMSNNWLDPSKKYFPPEEIIAVVEEHFGLRAGDIISGPRPRVFVRPRHLAMYLARDLNNGEISYPALGKAFGGKDHTTVMNAVENITADLKAGDEEVTRHIQELEAKLGKPMGLTAVFVTEQGLARYKPFWLTAEELEVFKPHTVGLQLPGETEAKLWIDHALAAYDRLCRFGSTLVDVAEEQESEDLQTDS